jgi:hypothetical protein
MKILEHAKRLWTEQTQLLVLSLVIVSSGLALHIASSYLPKTAFLGSLSEALSAIGTTVVSVGLVALVVRSWIWNEAIERTLSRVTIAESVKSSGLARIEFFPDVDWKSLFESSTDISIAAVSARSFLSGVTSTHVKAAIARTNVSVRVILSDPFSETLMDQYDLRFGEAKGSRAEKSKRALREFIELIKDVPEVDSRVTFCFLSSPFGYSYYRFDELRIIAPYLNEQNQRDSAKIPLFFFRDGSVSTRTIDPDIAAISATATAMNRTQIAERLAPSK